MEDNMREMVEEEHKLKGEILTSFVGLEGSLNFFIMDYFVRPQSSLSFNFSDLVLSKLNFEKKKDIFKKICKEEKIESNLISNIMQKMKKAQELRNQVAHWEMQITELSEGKVIKHVRPRSITTSQDMFKLDNKIEGFRKNLRYANRKIADIHIELKNKYNSEYGFLKKKWVKKINN